MMDTTESRMTNLFEQLGLDSSPEAIAGFIREHQLPGDVTLAEAPFWTAAQRQFLTEEWREDADWAIVVDELNEALHADSTAA